MPYTPPSPSPSATNASSRTSSRSSSFSTPTPSTIAEHSTVTATPSRASTYLQKHRRSQGYNRNPDTTANGKPVNTSKATVSVTSPSNERVSVHLLNPPRSISSLRQSPAPVSQDSMIPTGAVISPPDSPQNSSDDEASDDIQKRGRQLVNMAELEEALSSLPQHRVPSPDQSPVAITEQNLLASPIQLSSPEMLSARIHSKISAHSRSSSDSSALKHPEQRERKVVMTTKVSDNDSDDEEVTVRIAPPMVRKKSGELVKSSLKSPGGKRPRPLSMPSTPTYPKAVHFDSHLEHVRHFLQAERPTAVSAGSSPVESAIENEGEYPFPHDDEPPFEWELNLPNFPDRIDRSGWVVRVERVYLSHDNKSLMGTVAVANLAFNKFVVTRFTLDYWQTTSETVCEYNDDVRRKLKEDGCDRFSFKIRLDEISNLENKTLFFCVRYKVNGQEYWDNNSSMNYQVDFKKKLVPQNGKFGNPRAVTLPRSRPKPNTNSRPRSMPIFDDSFDAFEGARQSSSKYTFPPTTAISGAPRTKKSAKVSLVDNDGHENPARRTTPSGNAFGNRYDFETSLANAITTAAKVLGPERSGLTVKGNITTPVNPSPYFKNSSSPGSDLTKSALPRSHSSPALAATPGQLPVPTSKSEKPLNAPLKPLLKHLDSEDKPSIESPSYRELLEQYCFFGSPNASPAMATGGNMPEKPSVKHIDEVNTNRLVLPVYNLGVPTSRSPSPRVPVGSPRFNPSPSNLSMSPSQRSSESSSPISIAFGFPNRGLAMDSTHTPTAVHT